MSYHCTVKEGNLLTEPESTFIVNASNTKLLLGSGVAMAFKRHCGQELQDEMLRSLDKTPHPLEQGDVLITSSGKADNFIYALHVAVMDYNSGTRYDQKSPTLEVIQTALENIEAHLNRYAKKTDRSIKLVLPLMGCGVGNLNKIDVIKLYKHFFERKPAFDCEVFIYGHRREDYKLIQSLFE
jgi:O-acetyl-ADP-ribose deacetylase